MPTKTTEGDDEEDEDYEDEEYLQDRIDELTQERPPPVGPYTLNRQNLGQHLDQILLADYEPETATSEHIDEFESRQQEAVDVLYDSARVAHHVADLLTNFEVQSAGQRKFPSNSPRSPLHAHYTMHKMHTIQNSITYSYLLFRTL